MRLVKRLILFVFALAIVYFLLIAINLTFFKPGVKNVLIEGTVKNYFSKPEPYFKPKPNMKLVLNYKYYERPSHYPGKSIDLITDENGSFTYKIEERVTQFSIVVDYKKGAFTYVDGQVDKKKHQLSFTIDEERDNIQVSEMTSGVTVNNIRQYAPEQLTGSDYPIK